MKKILFTGIVFLISVAVTAQNIPHRELQFNHLFIKDGMPEGTVTSLLEDKAGYIWIGTQKGLVRYDGYFPKVYMLGVSTPSVLIISTINQNTHGRIWVGTQQSGLYMYDSSHDRFIHFPLFSSKVNRKETTSLTEFVTDIMEDKSGDIWVLTSRWLSPSEGKGFLIYHLNPLTKKIKYFGGAEKGKYHIDASIFYKFFQDKEGDLWISADNGLFEYNNHSGGFDHHAFSSHDLSQVGLGQVYHDPAHSDIYWISNTRLNLIYEPMEVAGEGLCRYDMQNDSLKVYSHSPANPKSIASDTVFAVRRDRSGQLWVATENGISLFNPATDDFVNYVSKEGQGSAIRELVEDKNGNFWCASPDGLIYFNTHTRKFAHYNGGEIGNQLLISNATHHLLLGERGTLWFGVTQKGVLWIDHLRSRFVQNSDTQKPPHYFQGGSVATLAKARDGMIWLGTGRGVYRWQPGTNMFSEIKINGKSLPVQKIIIDKKGYVWLGALTGLYRYNPETGETKHFQYDKNDSTSLSNNHVLSMIEDHLGNLWVGTFGGGLCLFNRESQNFIRYPYLKNNMTVGPNQEGTDNSEINALYEDKKGTIWAGCNTYGSIDSLNRKTGTFTSYATSAPGFTAILGIYEDSKDRLWAGTFIGGVFCLDKKRSTVTNYNQKNGLLYDRVSGILEDYKGDLWLTSARGISILNPQTRKVRTITGMDGLPSENLLWAFEINDSLFLFGTDNGFFTLNPHDFVPDPLPPEVHIQTLEFINPRDKNAKDSTIVVSGKEEIQLAHNENRLTFHYVGLYYQNASATQYSYKLDGYDQNWIQAGTSRTITYTNLSPGTYTFRVKAANSDGAWSREESLVVVIRSPWWQTWWAYLIYALLLITSVWGYINYRSRNLKRKNQILEKKVSQRTNELKQSLDNLKSTQKQLIQSEKMASLGELTAGIAHEIQNPLNFVNNFSDINKELLEELKGEADNGNIEEVKTIANDVIANEEKINHHGKRADAIVKGMLQHSRTSTGQKELTDLNALCDEYLRLAYHGMRAKDKNFNCTLETQLDSSLPKINVVPQDIGRVLLNLINNALFTVGEKSKQQISGYDPTVTIHTKNSGDSIEIIVKDNGNGIPEEIKDKIFQPFFTTKPTGQGTGLGLSLSYDIVTKEHDGTIRVESLLSSDGKSMEGTAFIIQLPGKGTI